MSSDQFAELIGKHYVLDEIFVQHISMFLASDQREVFLDFVGIEWEDDE